MTTTMVLGSGIVGSAAAWDLVRRGHTVTVADADPAVARSVASAVGATPAHVDVGQLDRLTTSLDGYDAVVSAVPYRFGVDVAAAAIAAGAHYADFGGNPTIVRRQLEMDAAARAAGVVVVPDCGLAPGLANVIAEHLIATASGPVRSAQIRVGALPRRPVGSLGYQLAFSPAGLINEYAEPCEILDGGVRRTVDPLTRFEALDWEGIGPLEAFATAGGTSTMCRDHEGDVEALEYKTLRFPGHGRIFAAMRELGLFDETGDPSPRSVVVAALAESLPSGGDDQVLVRVSVDDDAGSRIVELLDIADGRFSALARTTAFPATAFVDLVTRGSVTATGARAMHRAVEAPMLLDELLPVGIVPSERSGG